MIVDQQNGSGALKRLLCLLIIMVLSFGLFGLGCSMIPQKSPDSSKEKSLGEGNEKPTSPAEMEDMLNNLNSITQILAEPAGMTKNPPEQLSPQNQGAGKNPGQTGKISSQGTENQEQNKDQNQKTDSQNKKSDSGSEADSQGGEGKENEEQQSGKAETKESKAESQPGATASEPKQPWPLVEQMVQGLHQQWNALEPKLIKAGAEPRLIAGFEEQLEKLTKEAADRKALPTVIENNELYKYIADFALLFQNQLAPEIHRLRYNLNAILLQIKAEDWKATQQHLAVLQEVWKFSQSKMMKTDPELSSQFDCSLTDLEPVIGKQDRTLSAIKARISLNNLGELESKLEQKKSGSNQGQNQNRGETENQNQGL